MSLKSFNRSRLILLVIAATAYSTGVLSIVFNDKTRATDHITVRVPVEGPKGPAIDWLEEDNKWAVYSSSARYAEHQERGRLLYKLFERDWERGKYWPAAKPASE